MAMGWIAKRLGNVVVLIARLLTGVQARWQAGPPSSSPKVYFANHSSHGDFVLVWGSLPPSLRAVTRPVAGADYWNRSALRRFIGRAVFTALLIDRTAGAPAGNGVNAVAQMEQALRNGESLILFPEGTRNTTPDRLLPFKSGIFHLAHACPALEFVPVWIENLNRVLPKGESIPIPVLCTVTFGEPLHIATHEPKDRFLARCREALLSLAPVGQ
jgi:1-acyl-sn-glycerol-3-phosphate acyltransferase